MNIVSTLNKELLNQPFTNNEDEVGLLRECRLIAHRYAKVENSVAVLSDLKSNKSYIYNGGLAEVLGIGKRDSFKEINSIWEKSIFDRIHPDDLINKHLLELHFFHLLKNISIRERSDYHITSNMRMLNQAGEYICINHRMFYLCSCASGNLWLALCLYNYSYVRLEPDAINGIIFNSATGSIIKPNEQKCSNILSSREKQILLLIEKGKISKEIAGALSISINTVNRHRQNILEKLRVKNSIEAFRLAKLMGLL